MTAADVAWMRERWPDYVAAAERNLRWNLAVLLGDAATFSFTMGLLSETAILPAFLRTLTDAPWAFAVLGATYALTRFLLQIVGTRLASGRRRRMPLVLVIAWAERLVILGIALVVSTVGSLPDGVVLALFLVAVALYSGTIGLILPIYGDYVAKAVVRNRGTFAGTAQLVGGLVGFGSAMIATRLLGTLPHPAGFQATFWLAFASSFAAMLFLHLLREVPFPEPTARLSMGELVRGIGPLLRAHAAYRWFITGRSLVAVATMGIAFVAAAALDSGLGAADVAAFASVYLLAQSIGGFGWGLLAERVGWKVVVEGGAVALATGMLIAASAGSFAGFAAAFACLGLANAASYTSDSNLTMEIAPPGDTSRYLGITSSLIAPSLALAPIVGGIIGGLAGYQLLFGTAAIVALAGLVTIRRRFPEPRRARAGMIRAAEPSAVGPVGGPG